MRAVERSLNSLRRCRAFQIRSSRFAESVSRALVRILEARAAGYKPVPPTTRLATRATTLLMNTV